MLLIQSKHTTCIQVVFVDTDPDNLSDPSFEFLGPALENHFTFPEKTNAEFVKVNFVVSSLSSLCHLDYDHHVRYCLVNT
jgi:hypothetical protein